VKLVKKEFVMAERSSEQQVLNHIQELVDEEHNLYNKEALTEEDRKRLNNLEVQLDQCWDLLRQRRALRDAGDDPEKAHVRPAEVVEKYEN
jgi:NAD+--asparagine ADP-ribosyltransferase